MEFAKRMEQFGEGVFSRLAEMRRSRVAEGKEVFDLSIGAPYSPCQKDYGGHGEGRHGAEKLRLCHQ